MASSNDHANVAELLLLKRTNIKAKENDKKTPLDLASYIDQANVDKALLLKEDDIKANDNNVRALPHWACSFNLLGMTLKT